MKAFWMQMIDLGLFFGYLKGRCHGNQFYEKNAKPPIFVALAFRNGMVYRYLNVRINSHISAFDRFLRNLAPRASAPDYPLKFSEFENPRWRMNVS